jgi:hypothetical protein
MMSARAKSRVIMNEHRSEERARRGVHVVMSARAKSRVIL